MAVDLSLIFKAYDVRGVYPEQFDEDAARRIGRAFARWIGAERIVLGRDCRLSSPALSEAFVEGVVGEGTGVVDLGLATTDLVYFASGRFDLPGAMFTASHNPAQYNGLKLCRPGAAPVGEETGLLDVRDLAAGLNGARAPSSASGAVEHRDILEEYLEHLLSFADLETFRPLTVAADAANGMAGLVVPRLFERLPATLVPLYMDLDGTFPNHPADPLQPANQRDLQARVRAGGFDVGLAFDGDADRVFVVDELGHGLSGSTTTGILAAAILRTDPGATVLHNLICSRAVPEVIREHGGVPVRTKVGHSFIKQVMADTGAVFGGEHSAHYYFARNYRADSGLIATMLLLGEVSRSAQELSIVRKPFERYSQSGEINTQVADAAAVLAAVRAEMADYPQDDLDGLTIDRGSWWFNLRPSNTEPLLRLNLEAATRDECDAHVAELLALITSA
jgi:phosphomannomutase